MGGCSCSKIPKRLVKDVKRKQMGSSNLSMQVQKTIVLINKSRNQSSLSKKKIQKDAKKYSREREVIWSKKKRSVSSGSKRRSFKIQISENEDSKSKNSRAVSIDSSSFSASRGTSQRSFYKKRFVGLDNIVGKDKGFFFKSKGEKKISLKIQSNRVTGDVMQHRDDENQQFRSVTQQSGKRKKFTKRRRKSVFSNLNKQNVNSVSYKIFEERLNKNYVEKQSSRRKLLKSLKKFPNQRIPNLLKNANTLKNLKFHKVINISSYKKTSPLVQKLGLKQPSRGNFTPSERRLAIKKELENIKKSADGFNWERRKRFKSMIKSFEPQKETGEKINTPIQAKFKIYRVKSPSKLDNSRQEGALKAKTHRTKTTIREEHVQNKRTSLTKKSATDRKPNTVEQKDTLPLENDLMDCKMKSKISPTYPRRVSLFKDSLNLSRITPILNNSGQLDNNSMIKSILNQDQIERKHPNGNTINPKAILDEPSTKSRLVKFADESKMEINIEDKNQGIEAYMQDNRPDNSFLEMIDVLDESPILKRSGERAKFIREMTNSDNFFSNRKRSLFSRIKKCNPEIENNELNEDMIDG